MTILNREEAAQAAERKTSNVVNTCQLVTRGYYGAPSVGDFDGDGAADAEDGWKSEPPKHRHGDRNPPRGTPVSFVGGSKDHGHRAISLGNGVIRSTDFDGVSKRYRARSMGNGSIAQIEKAMGVTYVGWSDTIDGELIPMPPPAGPMTRGNKIDEAIARLEKAEKRAPDGTERDTSIKKALAKLRKITPWRKK